MNSYWTCIGNYWALAIFFSHNFCIKLTNENLFFSQFFIVIVSIYNKYTLIVS